LSGSAEGSGREEVKQKMNQIQLSRFAQVLRTIQKTTCFKMWRIAPGFILVRKFTGALGRWTTVFGQIIIFLKR
jgi:hypothetical protein